MNMKNNSTLLVFDLDNTLIDTKFAKARNKITGTEYSSEEYNKLESTSEYVDHDEFDYSDFDSVSILNNEKTLWPFDVLKIIESMLPGNCHIITGRHNPDVIKFWLSRKEIEISPNHIHCPNYGDSISDFKYDTVENILEDNPNYKEVFIFEDNEEYAKSMIRSAMDRNVIPIWVCPNDRKEYKQSFIISKILTGMHDACKQ